MAGRVCHLERENAEQFGLLLEQEIPLDFNKLGLDEGTYTTLSEDGKTKKILREEGSGNVPKDGDLVCLKYDSYSADGQLIKGNGYIEFVMNDDQTLEAFEICTKSMREGEKAVLLAGREYAESKKDCRTDVTTATEPLIFHIQLVRNYGHFNHRNYMSLEHRTFFVKQLIQRGHFLYVRGEHHRAGELYTKALTYLHDFDDRNIQMSGATEEESLLVDFLHYTIYSSLTTTYIHLNRMRSALAACDQVLMLKPFDAEAKYRKGLCLLCLGHDQDAIKYFLSAYNADRTNLCIKMEVERLLRKVNADGPASPTKEKKRGQGGKVGRKFMKKNAAKKNNPSAMDLPVDFNLRRLDGIETIGDKGNNVEIAMKFLSELSAKNKPASLLNLDKGKTAFNSQNENQTEGQSNGKMLSKQIDNISLDSEND